MQIQENQEIPQQIICPVCLGIYSPPVTIECGHTFCRKCLLNSINIKHLCPTCRKDLPSLSDRPQQDQTLSKIISYISSQHNSSNRIQNQQNQKLMESSHKFLYIKIQTSELLLPYTKVIATFQLQHTSLLSRLNKFIAVQDSPFHKYGVISTIISVNRLSNAVYQCVIQGQSFCQIEEERVEKGMELNDQYFYRECSVKIIYEEQDGNIDNQTINRFNTMLSKVKNKRILQAVYRVISPQIFNKGDDNLAMFYSMARLVAVEDKAKYQILTSFNQEARKQWLKNFITELKFDPEKTPEKFISVQTQNPTKRIIAVLITILLLIFLVIVNSDNDQQLNL